MVTTAAQVDGVYRSLPTLPRENLVIEPVGRNTAPCIGLAALTVAARDPEGVMAVLPSDQFVADEPAFARVLTQSLQLAAHGEVVTVGIRPNRPETGFGYIQCGATLSEGARRVVRFVEKPDRATAERYLVSGDFLWNAGMFFFTARRIREEIARCMPDLSALLDGIARAPERAGELYPTAPKVSIDYGVMEKLGGQMAVVPADFGWSDVGSWSALGEVLPPDGTGNSVVGHAIALDAHNNVLVSDGKRLVAVVGVENLIIVATGDAVVVLPKERAQEIKRIVEALEATGNETYL